MNTVAVTADVHCPFSAAIEYADLYHNSHSGAGIMPYAHVVRHISCEANEIRDVTDETRVHEALLFRWSSPLPVLPPLIHGLVTVRPNGRTTRIRIEANYVARFGLFGRVIDVLVGRLIVRNVLRTFMHDLCRYIENTYELERTLTLGVYKSSY